MATILTSLTQVFFATGKIWALRIFYFMSNHSIMPATEPKIAIGCTVCGKCFSVDDLLVSLALFHQGSTLQEVLVSCPPSFPPPMSLSLSPPDRELVPSVEPVEDRPWPERSNYWENIRS